MDNIIFPTAFRLSRLLIPNLEKNITLNAFQAF